MVGKLKPLKDEDYEYEAKAEVKALTYLSYDANGCGPKSLGEFVIYSPLKIEGVGGKFRRN